MKAFDFSQFGDDADKMFDLVWTAFRITFGRKASGYEQLKICNKIGDKLTEASDPGNDDERKLKNKDARLLLEGHEHGKLLSMVEDEQVPWTYKAGPNVVRLIDALRTAPEVPVEEKKDLPK